MKGKIIMKRIALLLCLLLLLSGAAQAGEASVPAAEPAAGSSASEEDTGFDIVLTFSGDMLLASLKNQTAKGNFKDYAAKNEPSYFLQNVKSIFESDDLTIVNPV